MTLISPAAVEQKYGIAVAQLRYWRQHGIGPEYFQFTRRSICYSEEYLCDWLGDPANARIVAEPRQETRPVQHQIFARG